MFRFRVALLIVAAAWSGAGALAAAQDARERSVWDGVYTAQQAARGKERFEASCSRCHNVALIGSERGPALKGDAFIAKWQIENLGNLFTFIRDTMPRDGGAGVLSDEIKIDILAYLLQSNDIPAGSAELTADVRALEVIEIARPGERTGVPNFALVQVVGCLVQGPSHAWMLSRATEPVVTRDEEPTPALLGTALGGALGTQDVRLISASGFTPESQLGQKVEARGLLYRAGSETRLNLTSLRSARQRCAD